MFSYRMSLIRHRRRTFLLCKESGMQKWARMLVETGKAFVDLSEMTTQIREDSDFWSLPPLTISCWQTLLVITQNGQHHNQTDYILMRKRFRSGVNSAIPQSFAGADIGSDHDLLMMTFHLRLKRISKPKHTRPGKSDKSDLEN